MVYFPQFIKYKWVLIPLTSSSSSNVFMFLFLFPDFQWVQGDVCEVQLMVYNPMPYELRVENMVSESYCTLTNKCTVTCFEGKAVV